MFCFTENYIKFETDYNEELINQIKEVVLTEVLPNGNMKFTFK